MAITNKARHTWWDLLMLLTAPEAEFAKRRAWDSVHVSPRSTRARVAWERRQGWDRLSRDERINRYLAAVRDARRERAA